MIILQDGTNTYVYGVDRIAQINSTAPEYFLTDGLGSVRQLVDSTGAVMATLYANGAIVYWGKDVSKVREPSFENADEYARYLAYISALTATGIIAGNELGKKKPRPGYAFDFFELFNGSCQPLFSMEVPLWIP